MDRTWINHLDAWFWIRTHSVWNLCLYQIRKAEDVIESLNKAFESRVRLGIMSVLMVNDYADFATLKQLLNLSDGNVSSHIQALEKLHYVEIKKQFIGKKPNTSYAATPSGRAAFTAHLDALEKLLKLTSL